MRVLLLTVSFMTESTQVNNGMTVKATIIDSTFERRGYDRER